MPGPGSHGLSRRMRTSAFRRRRRHVSLLTRASSAREPCDSTVSPPAHLGWIRRRQGGRGGGLAVSGFSVKGKALPGLHWRIFRGFVSFEKASHRAEYRHLIWNTGFGYVDLLQYDAKGTTITRECYYSGPLGFLYFKLSRGRSKDAKLRLMVAKL